MSTPHIAIPDTDPEHNILPSDLMKINRRRYTVRPGSIAWHLLRYLGYPLSMTVGGIGLGAVVTALILGGALMAWR